MSMYYMPELWSTIEEEANKRDLFARVAKFCDEHRDEHQCDAYPSTLDAPLVATIAKATGAKRLLEVGCGLGYSALWLAYGAGLGAGVETIEKDVGHRELAASIIQSEGYADRIKILTGRSEEVLKKLEGPYDLIYIDADIGAYLKDLTQFGRLLRLGGVLASANLFLDNVHPEMKGASNLERYRERLFTDKKWFTCILPLTVGLAISVRQ